MKRILIYLMILCPLALSAQTYEEGNEAYTAGDYEGAISAYTAVLIDNPAAEVYYNLGNAYFKTGELAQSILAYERALRINPRYKDAQYNLRFAESRIQDNIEDTHAFFLSQWAHNLCIQLRESTWLIMSITLFLLCLSCAFIFAFIHPIAIRKTAFHIAWISLILSIFCFCFSYSLHHRDSAREEAIITQGVVNAKSSPDKSGTDLFVLHEGTKVRCKDMVSGWVEIHVGDNVGWIKQSALERI